MSVLVVGYGSIGRRHVRLLQEEKHEAAVVSKHGAVEAKAAGARTYDSLEEALEYESPRLVIIANRTCEHEGTLSALLASGYTGNVLVEKPLFQRMPEASMTRQLMSMGDRLSVFIAYNLRFHPVLSRLKELIGTNQVLSVHVYAGQYLPDWRSGDYRKRYSARRSEGGGVLRDLSHELDYTEWLFGAWQRVAAVGGRYSNLELDSDDLFALLLVTERCPVVTIQLNYVDRTAQRQLIVNTMDSTYTADLIRGTLAYGDKREIFAILPDDTYRTQLKTLTGGYSDKLCTVEEALSVVALVEAAEKAALLGRWITR
ncbi:Gfo/Idh/MocA family protein [Paenibacillus sp. GCM10012307]|uniref:Gfo/Idh/MocA family oxidoreductase n=1 Tax=Paenibacillus roseus TaxID=2798579 RepID=A0A934MJJ2_9BACL|nr:Gfo/Idh/MocA family oxidoreductase [Paenibacillus roseus]